MYGMKMIIKKRRALIRVSLVIIFICLFPLSVDGKETEDHRIEEWGEEWFGGDFSDVECGEAVIHISFSEKAREAFGTCEESINVAIRSEGTWWTYGGRDWYSDIIKVEFDKTVGYQLRKILPYGKYNIDGIYYLGNVSDTSYSYSAYQCPVLFEISKEQPEIPVFFEFKEKELQEAEEECFEDKTSSYYDNLYDKAKEKGLNPRGKVQFHAELEYPGDGQIVVVELEQSNPGITEIHYFGKTNNYTYTAELYPGVYRIHRAYFIAQEGFVMGEDEAIRNSKFEVLPQSDLVEIKLKVNKNQKTITANEVTKIPEKAVSEIAEKEITETSEIAGTENTLNNKEINLRIQRQKQLRVIVYHLIALIVLACFVVCGYYWWKNGN